MRDSFVFYRSFYEATKELDSDIFKRCMVALFEYGLDGVQNNLNGAELIFLEMAKPQIDKNNQRYENGKKGGRPKTEQNQNKPKETKQNQIKPNETKLKKAKPNVNVNVNDNVNVNVNENVNGGYRGKFQKPTIMEIKQYITEKQLHVNAQRFFDYYESNGWKVGKNPMKNWKACLNNWNNNQYNKSDTLPSYMINTVEEIGKDENLNNHIDELMGGLHGN